MKQIASRTEFGDLVTAYHKTGAGAEIGVWHGEFTKLVLCTWPGMIFCVDTWESLDDYNHTKSNLFDKNVVLIRKPSVEAANDIPDRSLDWVYIDADHSYESVKADYAAWFPKVRVGGIVAGHDYGENLYGVKKFIDELGIDISLTTDDIDDHDGTHYQTWYFEKK